MGVSVRVLGEAGGVVPDARRAGYLVLGLSDGLAGLQRLDQGQLVAFSFNPAGDAPQQGGPFRTGGSRPVTGAKRLVGRGDGGIDVGLAGAVVAGDAHVMGRTVAQHLRASTADLAAVDDVGPGVRGDGGRGCAGDRRHDSAFGQVPR